MRRIAEDALLGLAGITEYLIGIGETAWKIGSRGRGWLLAALVFLFLLW